MRGVCIEDDSIVLLYSVPISSAILSYPVAYPSHVLYPVCCMFWVVWGLEKRLRFVLSAAKDEPLTTTETVKRS